MKGAGRGRAVGDEDDDDYLPSDADQDDGGEGGGESSSLGEEEEEEQAEKKPSSVSRGKVHRTLDLLCFDVSFSGIPINAIFVNV